MGGGAAGVRAFEDCARCSYRGASASLLSGVCGRRPGAALTDLPSSLASSLAPLTMPANDTELAPACWVSTAAADLTDVWHVFVEQGVKDVRSEPGFDEAVRAKMWEYLYGAGLKQREPGVIPRLDERQQQICDAVHVAAARVVAEQGMGRY